MDKSNRTKKNKANLKYRKLIYYIVGVLEVLFMFRFLLKILGSNPETLFVKGIYSFTSIFLTPFVGILRSFSTDGIETSAVLEPALIIAMIVYAVVGYGIVKLIEIMSNRNDSQTL